MCHPAPAVTHAGIFLQNWKKSAYDIRITYRTTPNNSILSSLENDLLISFNGLKEKCVFYFFGTEKHLKIDF